MGLKWWVYTIGFIWLTLSPLAAEESVQLEEMPSELPSGMLVSGNKLSSTDPVISDDTQNGGDTEKQPEVEEASERTESNSSDQKVLKDSEESTSLSIVETGKTDVERPLPLQRTKSDTNKMMITLFLFVLIMLGVTWYIRKQTKGGLLNTQSIRVSGYLSLGNKEKIAMIRVRDKEILVGVTAQHIQTLHTFDALDEEASIKGHGDQANSLVSQPVSSFQSLLNAVRQPRAQVTDPKQEK